MMTPQERLDALLDDVWVPTNRQVLFADITAVIGMEATALVIGTMKAGSATNPLLDTLSLQCPQMGFRYQRQIGKQLSMHLQPLVVGPMRCVMR
jgi:hypothetical protein